MNMRVTRTLVYEGLEGWVLNTLERSHIKTPDGFICPNGSIKQTELVTEWFEAPAAALGGSAMGYPNTEEPSSDA